MAPTKTRYWTRTMLPKNSCPPPQLDGGEKELIDTHLNELKNSAITESIARLNFETLQGQVALEAIAGKRLGEVGANGQQYVTEETKNILDRYEHLKDGGWWCSGLDPLQNWQLMVWGCFKPDCPRNDPKRNRLIKYEHPAKISTRLFFLKTEQQDYWQVVESDRSIPIIITEGAKKAACGLSHGFATVAASGIWNITQRVEPSGVQLHPDLKNIVAGRTIYLAFDQDQNIKAKRNVRQAIQRAAQCLAQAGAEVYVVHWLPEQGKGLDDFIYQHGVEAFQQALDSARPYDPRVKVVLKTGRIAEAEELVIRHLGAMAEDRDRLYTQGNSQGYRLIRILKAEADINSRYLAIFKDIDIIDVLSAEGLQHKINREIQLYKEVWHKKSQSFVEQPIDCPLSFCKQILAAGRYPNVLRLRGLCYHPLLLKDGTMIRKPGYHRGTGYLLQFDPSEFQLSDYSTKDDAAKALITLEDLLFEFCFKTDIDKSAAIALILTAVSRKLYMLAPMFCVNAHQPGTGKGTLVTLANILATGNRDSGVTTYTDDDAEMKKKLVSTLLTGTPIINIDNVDRRIGGGVLEMVLTTEIYRERILGQSKDVTLDTQRLWTANGNNLQFTQDMFRRIILCELDAKTERPEQRIFKRNIETYAIENRGKLVSAVLTILQAYIQAGCPEIKGLDGKTIPQLGSFQDWDLVVRRPLLWLGMPDPVQSQEKTREHDKSRLAHGIFLESWHDLLGSTPYKAKEIIQKAITCSQDRDEVKCIDFRDSVLDVCLDRHGQPSPRILGYYLRNHNGVVVNNLRLVRKKGSKNTAIWLVEKMNNDEQEASPFITTPISKSISERELEQDGDKNQYHHPNRSTNQQGRRALNLSPSISKDYGIKDLRKEVVMGGDTQHSLHLSGQDSISNENKVNNDDEWEDIE